MTRLKACTILLIATLLTGSTAWAQANPVVAQVDGATIRLSDLKAIHQSHPQARLMPLEAIYGQLLDLAVESALLDKEAQKANLGEDPEVQTRLAEVKANLMRRAYLRKRRDEKLTEAVLRERYAAFLKDNPPQEEIRVRQILTETEGQAKAAIAELISGADFPGLARRASIGTSAEEGGVLGYITRSDVSEAFAAAAFTQPVGRFTTTPVKTNLGWHVIKVEDKRVIQPPGFEEIRDDLVRDLTEEISREVIKDLKGRAQVTRYGLDGKKLP